MLKIAAATPALPKTKQERSSALGSYLLKVCFCSKDTNRTFGRSVDFTRFVLSLPEPPCILEKPESMSVLPGSKVQFNVLLSGTPPLTIKWFKNKKEILSSAGCSVTKDNTCSSLELFFVKTSDSGEYVCEIQNDVGSTSCQTTLFVKGQWSLCDTELISMFPSICSHVLWCI